MRFHKAGTTRRFLLPLVVAAACAAGAYGYIHWLGNESVVRHQVTLVDLNQDPVRGLTNLAFDTASRTARATGDRPSFLIAASSGREELWAVTIRLQPLKPLAENDFLAFRAGPVSKELENNRFHHYWVTRGSPQHDGGDLIVRWYFPEATEACRVECPAGASFEVQSLEVVEGPVEPPAGTFAGVLQCGRVVAGGLILWGMTLAMQLAWPATRAQPETVRGAILIGLAVSCGLNVVLIAPFQGPDEWRHWKAALAMYRKGATEEAALFNLPEAMGTMRLAFKSENQFDARQLYVSPTEEGLPGSSWEVTYGNPLTYPVIGLTSLLFPRVETTTEALLFYYLCRALPAALLLALLLAANRAHLLSWMAVVFFSSPLVQQQFTIITSDTLPNLGTLAALLLFAACRKQPRPWLHVALWTVSLLVVLAKPPVYAGLLLLPLQLVAFNKIPRWKLVVPLAGAVLLLAAFWAGQKSLVLLGNVDESTPIGQQWARVRDQGPGDFLRAWHDLATSTSWVHDSFGPLGWLDTYFTQRHLTLIYLSVWLGVLFDLLVFAPWLIRQMMRAPVQAVVTVGSISINALFLYLSISFIMYLAETPPGSPGLLGVQMRYLFPGLMVALMLPQATFGSPEASPAAPGQAARVRLFVGSASMSLLPWLLFARQVELTTTLLTRYW